MSTLCVILIDQIHKYQTLVVQDAGSSNYTCESCSGKGAGGSRFFPTRPSTTGLNWPRVADWQARQGLQGSLPTFPGELICNTDYRPQIIHVVIALSIIMCRPSHRWGLATTERTRPGSHVGLSHSSRHKPEWRSPSRTESQLPTSRLTLHAESPTIYIHSNICLLPTGCAVHSG